MSKFAPFQNEAQAVDIGGLSVENRLDRVALFGNVDLTLDKRGLEVATRLKVVLDAVVATLEATPDLPDEVATDPNAVTGPRDPFA
jgi:hypothetical protein